MLSNVLEQDQYNIANGVWLELPYYKGRILNQDLQSLLTKDKIQCKVCGIGALFASTVCFQNQVIAESFQFDDTATLYSKQLADLFSQNQRNMIEFAFEKGSGYTSDADFNSDYTYCKLIDFIDKNGNKKDQTEEDYLLIIMRNIVRNKGTFKP